MPEAVRIVGEKNLIKAFDLLPERIQRKHVRRGVTKGGRLIAKAAKAKAPRETGLLRLSIGQKVRTYKDKGLVLVVVGPRRGFRRRVMIKQLKKGGSKLTYGKKGQAGGVAWRNPTRYAATVEHYRPYLRPAYDSQQGPAQGEVRTAVAEGLRQEAAALPKG